MSSGNNNSFKTTRKPYGSVSNLPEARVALVEILVLAEANSIEPVAAAATKFCQIAALMRGILAVTSDCSLRELKEAHQ